MTMINFDSIGSIISITKNFYGFELQPKLAKILAKRLRRRCNKRLEHFPRSAETFHYLGDLVWTVSYKKNIYWMKDYLNFVWTVGSRS